MAEGPGSRGGRGDPQGRLVRPYMVTGGKSAASRDDLAIETLVSTSLLADVGGDLSFERRAIADLCRQTQSVAEVSAHLGLPLGVVRVLVSDMADEGLLQLHHPGHSPDDRPELALLRRVLDGLRTM